jgi:molybdate transport system substrate-binding protein
VIDSATAEMCGQVIYPAAVMKDSKDPEAAQAFLDYLGEDEAMELFEEVGFSRIETEKETEAEP